jgi:hypothetical protein
MPHNAAEPQTARDDSGLRPVHRLKSVRRLKSAPQGRLQIFATREEMKRL